MLSPQMHVWKSLIMITFCYCSQQKELAPSTALQSNSMFKNVTPYLYLGVVLGIALLLYLIWAASSNQPEIENLLEDDTEEKQDKPEQRIFPNLENLPAADAKRGMEVQEPASGNSNPLKEVQKVPDFPNDASEIDNKVENYPKTTKNPDTLNTSSENVLKLRQTTSFVEVPANSGENSVTEQIASRQVLKSDLTVNENHESIPPITIDDEAEGQAPELIAQLEGTQTTVGEMMPKTANPSENTSNTSTKPISVNAAIQSLKGQSQSARHRVNGDSITGNENDPILTDPFILESENAKEQQNKPELSFEKPSSFAKGSKFLRSREFGSKSKEAANAEDSLHFRNKLEMFKFQFPLFVERLRSFDHCLQDAVKKSNVEDITEAFNLLDLQMAELLNSRAVMEGYCSATIIGMRIFLPLRSITFWLNVVVNNYNKTKSLFERGKDTGQLIEDLIGVEHDIKKSNFEEFIQHISVLLDE